MGYTLGGLVAGEGCFSITPRLPPLADGTPRVRFVFGVELAERDHSVLEALRSFLGTGSIYRRRPRHGWQPTATFTVASLRGHRRATIPFAERFLLPSAKRRQFELWRDALLAYDAINPSRWGRGPSTCSEAGCEAPVRGRGLCRRHYYRVTGY